MGELINYQDIDPEISKATAKKFWNHLWYLVPETVGLCIVDDNVPTQVRANMAQVMLEADKGEEEEINEVKGYNLHQKYVFSFTNLEFSSFQKNYSPDFLSRPISSAKILQHGTMILVQKWI